jgi:NAD(P)-dependent dehydrogenase (short-subunit alcohol dehydrogenase family)
MIRSVIITGAAGNLGRAVCEKFLAEAWQVTAVVGPGDDPDFLKDRNFYAINIDLFNEKEIRNSLGQLFTDRGPFSFAVFTVGGFAMGDLRQTGLEELKKMFQLNFETAYSTARILFEHFEEEKNEGRMVFIGARPGLQVRQAGEVVAYGLSKSLVLNLAEIINAAGHRKKIDAAVVIPSIIDTPANRQAMPDADFGRWVKPEEIADNIFYLSTPAGRQQRDVILKVYGNS